MSETQVDTGEPVTNTVQVPDPRSWTPAAEPKETFHSDHASLRKLGNKRAGEAEADITIIEDVDDDTPRLSQKEAINRQRDKVVAARMLDRAKARQRRTGEHEWIAGHVVGQETRKDNQQPLEHRASRPVVEEPFTLTTEQARDQVVANRATIPQVLAEQDDQRKFFAEIDAGDLVQQHEAAAEPTAEPPPVQPEQQPRPQIDPIAEYRERAAAELQALQYLRNASHAEVLVASQIENLAQQHRNEFPDIRTMDDVQKMDAQRKACWVEYAGAMDKLVATQRHASTERENVQRRIADAHATQQAAEQQQQQQAFAQWKSHQDAIVERDVPALRDPVKRVEMTREAHGLMKEFLGLDEHSYRTLTPEARRLLHYSGTQKLISELAEFRLARRRAAEAGVPD